MVSSAERSAQSSGSCAHENKFLARCSFKTTADFLSRPLNHPSQPSSLRRKRHVVSIVHPCARTKIFFPLDLSHLRCDGRVSTSSILFVQHVLQALRLVHDAFGSRASPMRGPLPPFPRLFRRTRGSSYNLRSRPQNPGILCEEGTNTKC